MQKVQKTYTVEFKREAVRLAQTSGKSIAQVAGRARPRSLPRQWASDRSRRGGPPPQARTGNRETGARHTKKSSRHLFARPAMRYQFIAEHRHENPIMIMCRVLEVSASGYYAWCQRPPSRHSREDAQLAEKVKMAFQANRRVYGSPRIHAELQAQGIHCARKRVARLMRAQELFAQRPRHRTITTKSEPGAQVAPNLLQRDFSADEPNTK